MSLRIDTTEWLVGALLIGNTGAGVLAENISAAGDSGPGYAYNDLSLPADVGKEICGRITTWPTLGVLTAYENTSFVYVGATDSFAYQLYVGGVATGPVTAVTLQVGPPPANASAAQTLAPVTQVATFSTTPPAAATAAANQALPKFTQTAIAAASVGLPSGVVSMALSTVQLTFSVGAAQIQNGAIMTIITRRRGDTRPDEITVLVNGAAVDITGCSFIMTLDPAKAPLDATKNLHSLAGTIVDAPTGRVQFKPSAAQADHVGKFYYDVQMIDASGSYITLGLDRYVFTQDITK